MCYAVGSPSWRWWQTKDNEGHLCWVVEADKEQREASLLGHGDGQTRGLSLHAGLQPELDFDWITNTSIELAHTSIEREYTSIELAHTSIKLEHIN